MMKDQAKKKFVTKVTSKNKTKNSPKAICKRMWKAKNMAEKKEEVKGTNKIKNKAVGKEKTESRLMIATDKVQMKIKEMAMVVTMDKPVELREVKDKDKARAVDRNKDKTATTPISSGQTMPDYGRRMCWHRRKPTS